MILIVSIVNFFSYANRRKIHVSLLLLLLLLLLLSLCWETWLLWLYIAAGLTIKTSLNADNNSNNNNYNSIYLNMIKNSAKLMWSYTNNKIKLPN